MKDLKEKTIRGGLARLCAQGADFTMRLVSLMVLARLLNPKDFGLVGMVTAFTGVLILFRDFGLSAAAIQRPVVTEEQLSTLFWINVAVGAGLVLLILAMAPFIAIFYHEPRLLKVTAALSGSFLFNAAGIQHGALLQRQMRFTTLAVVSTISLVVSTALAIGAARAGWGYWALVVMTLATPIINTLGFWMTTKWVPGPPRKRTGIRSMMHFGGTITLNGLVIYISSNFEKVLLGRFWGADALGIYGRAYQLINIPTANLNSAAGEVAFSALSRLQDDPVRLKSYFLKGYSLVLAMTMPMTVACALFADDLIFVFLGPKWKAAAPIFRFLAPTIMAFAIANPLGWLIMSLGLVRRGLKMALVIAPLLILSYLIGLRWGPTGCCHRILDGHDALGVSVDCVGRARHRDFFLGCVAHCQQAGDIKHRGCRAGVCGTVFLRAVIESDPAFCARDFRAHDHVCRDAIVRDRAEGALYGSYSRTSASVSCQRRRREEPGFSLANEELRELLSDV